MSNRDFRNEQRALRDFDRAQRSINSIVSVQETLARMERDRLQAMQPITSLVADIVEMQRPRTADLALNAARAFSVRGAASQAAQGVADSTRKMLDISGSSSPFLKRPFVDLQETISNLSGKHAFLDAVAGGALQSNAQWKPVLTRFAQEPIQGMLSSQSVDLSRLVSNAVRPLASTAIADALASMRRSPMIDPSIFKIRTPASPFIDLPELDLPLLPEEPQEDPAVAESSAGQENRAAISAPGSEFVARAEFEALQQEVARLNHSFARMNRPLYIQWSEKLVIALLSGFILKVVWIHTAAGDVAEVVVDQIVVVIEGVVHVLPFIT